MRKIEEESKRERVKNEKSHGLSCTVTALNATVRHNSPNSEHVFIAVGGYAGIGKTTISKLLSTNLIDSSILSVDSFMLDRTKRRSLGLSGDHPDAIQFHELQDSLAMLKDGETLSLLDYNHTTGAHDIATTVRPAKYIIVEGTPATYPQLGDTMDLRIFLDAENDIRKFLVKEAEEKRQGYSEEEIEARWIKNYVPENAQFVEPTKYVPGTIIVNVNGQREYSSDIITTCIC